MKKFDYSQLMKKAWSLYRKAAKKAAITFACGSKPSAPSASYCFIHLRTAEWSICAMRAASHTSILLLMHACANLHFASYLTFPFRDIAMPPPFVAVFFFTVSYRGSISPEYG